MPKKEFLISLLTGVFLTIISFTSGIFYERWRESKNTLDLDPALISLLARPSDFEIMDIDWSKKEFFQSYNDPLINKGMKYPYERTVNAFSAYSSSTNIFFKVNHEIRRYAPEEMPETTLLDEITLGDKANPEMEDVHLLNLKVLDENSQAFCTVSKVYKYVICFVESKYKNIVSTLSIDSSNMEETQIVNFITPAIQKFYERLSKSSIN